jgi:hypothetical protein
MHAATGERIDGRRDYCAAVERVLALASLHVALYSPRLPGYAYGSRAGVETLKNWLITTPRARTRILVHEPRYAMSEPNRLILLGLRLSSSVSFRDAPSRLEPFGDRLIVDGRHVLIRPQPDSTSATLWLDSPLKAREELMRFDKLWEESTSSIEIRNRTI